MLPNTNNQTCKQLHCACHSCYLLATCIYTDCKGRIANPFCEGYERCIKAIRIRFGGIKRADSIR